MLGNRARRSRRSRARSSRTTSGTTTRRSTTRAGWSSSCRPRITDEQTARVQELAVRAFVATECEGMARADCFVRDDGEVLVNELNTIPGFTADERLREAVRGVGHPVRRAARPADRARARAPRAARAAALLSGARAYAALTSFTCATYRARRRARDPDRRSSGSPSLVEIERASGRRPSSPAPTVAGTARSGLCRPGSRP